MTPYDRDAARKRLQAKRARANALAISALLRQAGTGQTPELRDLLTSIAAEMDDYLDTHVQVTGGPSDHPIWLAAYRLARQLVGEPTA